MKKIIFIIILVVFSSAANAACKRPVGKFSGSGSGVAYNADNGQIINAASFSLSLTIDKNGNGRIVEYGKNLISDPANGYRYTDNFNFSSDFNTELCGGYVTTEDNRVFVYTSTLSGKKITFTYFSNNNVLVIYDVVLEIQ